MGANGTGKPAPLRSRRDRLLQAMAEEAGGILLVSPVYARDLRRQAGARPVRASGRDRCPELGLVPDLQHSLRPIRAGPGSPDASLATARTDGTSFTPSPYEGCVFVARGPGDRRARRSRACRRRWPSTLGWGPSTPATAIFSIWASTACGRVVPVRLVERIAASRKPSASVTLRGAEPGRCTVKLTALPNRPLGPLRRLGRRRLRGEGAWTKAAGKSGEVAPPI